MVSDDSPYGLLSAAAYEYWPKCDLLIGIGSRLELVHFRWRWMPEGLKTVRIDIDPTEFVRIRPDAGVVTDAKLGTSALIEELSSTIDKRSLAPTNSWATPPPRRPPSSRSSRR